MAWAFGYLSDTLRLRPTGAGGGLTSPRGITAARPPFFILRFGARPLGFIDFGDLMRLRCLLGASWGDLGEF